MSNSQSTNEKGYVLPKKEPATEDENNQGQSESNQDKPNKDTD